MISFEIVEASSFYEIKKSFYQQEYIDLNAQDNDKDKQPSFENNNELHNNALIKNDEQEEDLHSRK
ncbi:4455_t:CDS:2 [Cetraspora pellucida]|uniref:4455_t:CDS:1 n=1 Tax=Cetraspora pellucida TaxID=1433469 RepID=A0ACA9KH82_9GLOM|nr:4455_t:CDS:2 [Cetraspora pellucida]